MNEATLLVLDEILVQRVTIQTQLAYWGELKSTNRRTPKKRKEEVRENILTNFQ